MRYKNHFRLLVRLLGAYFLVEGTGQLLSMLAQAMTWFALPRGAMGNLNAWVFVGMFVVPTVKLAVGIYFLRGGRVLVNYAIPADHPYCPECGYDRTHSHSPVCPECGTDPLHGRH